MASAEEHSSRALTVSVAGEQLAISAREVAEVIRQPSVTRVPLSPPALLGVANLRGTVIPIVSLAVLLGSEEAGKSSGRVVVVDKANPVGLKVDQVLSLEEAAQLRSRGDAVRFVDVDSLLSPHFGASEKRAVSVVSFEADEIESGASADAAEAFFSFEIAGQQFGLPIDSVHEVLTIPGSLAIVPRTDDAMLGVITLRNRLLPVVSLGMLLGLGHSSAGSRRRIVVASIGGSSVALVVDSVKAVIRVSPEDIDPVPLVLTRGRQEAHIQAICRLDDGTRLVSILSSDHLLKDGLAERLAESQTGEDQMVEDAAGAKTEQFVIFQLGDEHYGLPVGSVAEVVAPPEKLTKLPKAPKFIQGVMNLRGQVVPVIDQRRRFEASSSGSARKARIIIVRIGEGTAGFVVDSVSEVLTVNVDQLRPAPELAAKRSKVIDRVANLELEDRMILLVDPQELLDRAEQDMLAAIHGNASAAS